MAARVVATLTHSPFEKATLDMAVLAPACCGDLAVTDARRFVVIGLAVWRGSGVGQAGATPSAGFVLESAANQTGTGWWSER
jgi:hypothetical protein